MKTTRAIGILLGLALVASPCWVQADATRSGAHATVAPLASVPPSEINLEYLLKLAALTRPQVKEWFESASPVLRE
jgi:hypothetical protein